MELPVLQRGSSSHRQKHFQRLRNILSMFFPVSFNISKTEAHLPEVDRQRSESSDLPLVVVLGSQDWHGGSENGVDSFGDQLRS